MTDKYTAEAHLTTGRNEDRMVVMYDSERCVKSYYRIVELQVLDWGTEFELVVKKGLE